MTKKKTTDDLQETAGGTNEQAVPVELDDEKPHYVFKSKFKEDVVTLKKGKKSALPDGTMNVEAPQTADFHRFTWATDDPEDAEKLRNIIERRLASGTPIHILETTEAKE